MSDAFESAVEPQGRYGAVYERDDQTAFFYLLDLDRPNNRQIIEALNVDFLDVLPTKSPATIIWGSVRRIVGLIVGGHLVAVFDLAAPSPHGRRATNEDMGYFRKN